MKTVLIIEDNPEFMENISEILEFNGYAVIMAVNGKEGLEVAAARKPDLILCDIMMPDMNGYDVLRALKVNASAADIQIVYVTASSEISEVKLAIEKDASGYVLKPFEVKELMREVRNNIGA